MGLLYFGQDLLRRLYWGDPIPWYEARFWIVRVLISAALTPAILWLGRRWPLERHNWLRRAGAHIVFSLGFALTRVVAEALIHMPLNAVADSPWDQGVSNAFVMSLIFGFHTGVIAYWIVLGVQAAFMYHGKFQEREQQALKLELHASELRAQVAQAQLGALKMQLQPHFLFNTLNAIVVLVRQGRQSKAEEALTRLSDLLRAVLDDLDAQEVPLSRELEYLRLYLAIEQMRFSDRLKVRIEADPEVLDALVPQLALQPIVENAVKHGISRCSASGSIEINVSRMGDMLEVTISDDGPGFSHEQVTRGHGVGLSNLRARLLRLYGAAAQLGIESKQGTVVTLRVPYRPAVIGEPLAAGNFVGRT